MFVSAAARRQGRSAAGDTNARRRTRSPSALKRGRCLPCMRRTAHPAAERHPQSPASGVHGMRKSEVIGALLSRAQLVNCRLRALAPYTMRNGSVDTAILRSKKIGGREGEPPCGTLLAGCPPIGITFLGFESPVALFPAQ